MMILILNTVVLVIELIDEEKNGIQLIRFKLVLAWNEFSSIAYLFYDIVLTNI